MASPALASVPLHQQIAHVLRARIESGRWPSGDSLTEQALCDEFRVSRPTLRQALAQLKELGLLESRRGVGTRGVAPSRTKTVRSSGNPLHASLNTTMRVHSLGRVPAPGPAAFFGMPQGEEVFRFVRVHALDGAPFSVIDSYIAARYAAAFTRASLKSASVHELLWRRFRLRQGRSVHALRIARADVDAAALLGVGLADPLLRVQSSVYLDDGAPIRWIENLFREERYEYVAEMDWPHPAKISRR